MTIRASFEPGCEPEQATSGSAGFDLKARLTGPVAITAYSRAIIPTGVRLAIPPGFEGQVRPRSGLAFKHGITILNAPGTIDSDYRGEISVALYNASDEPYIVGPGDRIAQLVIARCEAVTFEIGELGVSLRGEGGFGSTGR
ncbi:MAG: dUTP diphosphatase [Spirochaetales bacterium]